jgi:hypothetical protein
MPGMRAVSLFGDPNPHASPVLFHKERTVEDKAGAHLRKFFESVGRSRIEADGLIRVIHNKDTKRMWIVFFVNFVSLWRETQANPAFAVFPKDLVRAYNQVRRGALREAR